MSLWFYNFVPVEFRRDSRVSPTLPQLVVLSFLFIFFWKTESGFGRAPHLHIWFWAISNVTSPLVVPAPGVPLRTWFSAAPPSPPLLSVFCAAHPPSQLLPSQPHCLLLSVPPLGVPPVSGTSPLLGHCPSSPELLSRAGQLPGWTAQLCLLAGVLLPKSCPVLPSSPAMSEMPSRQWTPWWPGLKAHLRDHPVSSLPPSLLRKLAERGEPICPASLCRVDSREQEAGVPTSVSVPLRPLSRGSTH